MTLSGNRCRIHAKGYPPRNRSGSGYCRGTSEPHYRCYLPVLAGFMSSRLHGGRSLANRGGKKLLEMAERAGLEPAQAVRPAALPTRCHTIRRPLRTDQIELSPPANGGEGGIRTHGTRKGTTVFETARFNHSRTSPQDFSTRRDIFSAARGRTPA